MQVHVNLSLQFGAKVPIITFYVAEDHKLNVLVASNA